jgi:transcriptional regulator with XRE-family HTH domain
MFRKPEDDELNRYIRERIRQVRTAAHESQGDLAKRLEKSRVTVSDMERGRVAVSAADLAFIAGNYDKPISFFYPPSISVNKDQLSQLEEELIFLFSQLPTTQQRIALEYIKQQVEITIKASDQEFEERYAEFKSNRKKTSIFSVTSVDLNPEELKPNNKVGKSKK